MTARHIMPKCRFAFESSLKVLPRSNAAPLTEKAAFNVAEGLILFQTRRYVTAYKLGLVAWRL